MRASSQTLCASVLAKLVRCLVVVSVGGSYACGSTHSPEGSSGGPGSEGGSGARSSGGAPSSGGANGATSGGLNLAMGGWQNSSPDRQCSSDLQRVVNATGTVVEQCNADQGCAGGNCVDACDAAAASHGSIGCEFWALDSAVAFNGHEGDPNSGPCYAVFVANAWARPAKLSVSRAGQSFDVSAFAKIPRGAGKNLQYEALPADGLPPGEVAVLFLSHKPGTINLTSLECPVAPALLEDAAIQGSGRGFAFHVTSDTPLSAYDILPYGGATSYIPSATLLLPAATWGTNYVAVAPRNDLGNGEMWAAIVASEDGTTVQVLPRQALPGGANFPGAPVGAVSTYALNAGEALQWIEIEPRPDFDPSGAIFDSNKPISLWTGNTLANTRSITSPTGLEDSAHQQLPPIQALGNEYVGPSIVSRVLNAPESVPYRMLGVVDGTQLSWDAAAPPSAPSELNRGQIVDFETTELFSVHSQDADHPFIFTQFMAGTTKNDNIVACQPSDHCRVGDDDWVSLIPTKQFLQRYVFFTDPTYSTTNLVFIRSKGESGFSDVELDCLGTLTGWRPVGSAGNFEVAHVDLVNENVPVKDCLTSRHIASSAQPFGIVVWGTARAASYGYPAGGNFASVNTVVVQPSVR